ncbi:U3 snoRNP protein [Heterostelium album PN500]|uniref:U3 snoRNP protein n=1 Tax=Heterostelium pallidum (strain ATCC 26659 / Pp 5 / PN500) TaxID=670386 RepID=D3B3Q6_HETP5|nr:U3 snoRNP protein [Heterostelium album PN500]EFA83954.1 U3 snoRNP protein [Heterostelium album PN500]|eukprot:XP_020436071.1 U3 snoRNP protein [Heterostelium album PN500]
MVVKRKETTKVATTTTSTTKTNNTSKNVETTKKLKNDENDDLSKSILALGNDYDDDDLKFQSKYYNDDDDDEEDDQQDSDDDDDVEMDDELAGDNDFVDDDDEEMLDDSERTVGGGTITKEYNEATDKRYANLRVKSTDSTEQSRAPTTEEMQEFRETQDLFNSNLFRLQINELFREIKVNYTKTTALESALYQLKEIVESIPDQIVNVYSNNVESVKLLDITGEDLQLEFQKPSAVEIIGSYMLKTVTKSNPNVDMAVQIPESCFTKSDANNFKYFTKRNLYVWTLAQAIKKHSRFSNVQFTNFNGDSNKQILVVRPNADPASGAHTRFTIRIIPYISKSQFRIDTKFNPNANCIFTNNEQQQPTSNTNNTVYNVNTYKDNDIVLTQLPTTTTSTTNSKKENKKIFESIQRSAFYNNAVLEDALFFDHMNLLNEKIRNAPVLIDTIQLLKSWLLVKNIPTINSFHLSMLAAYLYSIGRINKAMSTYQAFRMTLVFISKDFNKPLEFKLEKNSTLKQGEYMESFQKLYPVILVDQSGLLNIFSRVTSWAFKELQNEAVKALKNLDSGDGFEDIFLTKNHPLLNYDYLINIKLSKECNLKVPTNDYFQEELYTDHSIYRSLYRSLTNRARSISVVSQAEPVCWDISQPIPESYNRIVQVAIQLNPDHWLRLIDMGPSADHRDAAKFRQVWGAKSQLRRFKDGSIHEAATWTPKDGLRHLVVEDIAKYILGHHLKVPAANIQSLITKFDRVLHSGAALEDHTLSAIKAKGKLQQEINSLQLPLKIQEFTAMNPALRYTSVATSYDPSYSQNTPIEILLHFEHSRFWTSDIDSIHALKTAFMLKIAKELDADTYRPQLTEDYLDVRTDGFLFRLIPYYSKETEHFTSRHADKQKKMMYFQRSYLHHQHIQALHTSYPSYGAATRLALRWVHSNHFTSTIKQQTIELIMAHIYKHVQLNRASNDTENNQVDYPVTPVLAFFRFLHLVAHHDWSEQPMIVDFTDSLSLADVNSIKAIFEQQKSVNNLPLFFIATDKDRPSVWWKDVNSRDVSVRERFVTLARESLELINSNFNDSQFDWLSIFQPSYTEYNVILTLNNQYITNYDREINQLINSTTLPTQSTIQQQQVKSNINNNTTPVNPYAKVNPLSLIKNLKSTPAQTTTTNDKPTATTTTATKTNIVSITKTNNNLIPGLNIVEVFINKLNDRFNEYCTFSYDGVGGDKIGIKWNTSLLEPHSLKPSKSQYTIPLIGEGLVKLNTFELVHEIQKVGGKLIKSVAFNQKDQIKLN